MTISFKMNQDLKVVFADLTHTGKNLSNKHVPFGVGLVAAYLKKEYPDIVIEIFKYPKKFAEYIENNNPQIICFHNTLWTENLSYEFVKRIKKHSPETIIVFGGPSYPIEPLKQKRFLQSHPLIDFFIKGEGELAFTELFEKLKKFNFNLEEYKKNKTKSGNCHYIFNNELITGETIERIKFLDSIPSPYLTGMLDKFFNNIFEPIIQTKRGCPYNCAYCQEGQEYFNHIYKFSIERIGAEIDYIAQRTKVKELLPADSNFGIYPGDIEVCKEIAKSKEKYNFPGFFGLSSGVNKEIITEALSILKDRTMVAIPVQSTDKEVLENINRRNVPIERLISIAQEGRNYNATTFSEVILALPGDTKEKHFKSILDMIKADIDVVRSHQFIMLPASEASTDYIRKKYGLITRFRVQPRCFGEYEIYGEKFPAFEIDEICIANDTLSYEDYLECRRFNLTVEIFYNSLFRDLINFLISKQVSIPSFILNIHDKIQLSTINSLYKEFIKENEDSLWESESDLKKYMNMEGTVKKIINENLRENEQLKYRSLIVLEKIKEMHDIAFETAKELLEEKNIFSQNQTFLDQLKRFSLLVKSDFFISKDIIEEFSYDLTELSKNKFKQDPVQFHIPSGIKIRIFSTPEQNQLINEHKNSSPETLGYLINRTDMNDFYKGFERVN